MKGVSNRLEASVVFQHTACPLSERPLASVDDEESRDMINVRMDLSTNRPVDNHERIEEIHSFGYSGHSRQDKARCGVVDRGFDKNYFTNDCTSSRPNTTISSIG